MRLLLSCFPLLIGLFLQTAPRIEAEPPTSASRDNGTAPRTDKVMTQNYSTVATEKHGTSSTTVNVSESLLTTHSTRSTAAAVREANGTTTESGSPTTSGGTSQTSAHSSASHFTENKTTMTILPTTKQFETTDYLSTSTLHVSTTSTNSRSASRFDVASFLGGIVLTLGLCVVTVFGYQCYKNRRPTAPPYRIVDE